MCSCYGTILEIVFYVMNLHHNMYYLFICLCVCCMCMSVLSACLSVYHVCVASTESKEVNRSPGTEVTDSCQPLNRC